MRLLLSTQSLQAGESARSQIFLFFGKVIDKRNILIVILHNCYIFQKNFEENSAENVESEEIRGNTARFGLVYPRLLTFSTEFSPFMFRKGKITICIIPCEKIKITSFFHILTHIFHIGNKDSVNIADKEKSEAFCEEKCFLSWNLSEFSRYCL